MMAGRRYVGSWVLAVSVCFAGEHAVAQQPRQQRQTAVILADTPLRLLPDLKLGPLVLMEAGVTVRVHRIEGSWAQVTVNGSQFGPRTGYIELRFIQPDTAAGTTRSNVTQKPVDANASALAPATAAAAPPKPVTSAAAALTENSKSLAPVASSAPLLSAAKEVSREGVGTSGDHMTTSGQTTLILTTGQSVAGSLIAATAQHVTLAIGGRRVSFAMTDVASMSPGAAETSAAPASAVASRASRASLDEALNALVELRSATKIGMPRNQYSEELANTLARVKAFTDGPAQDWLDVRLAMQMALSYYQYPLKDSSNWSDAGTCWSVATRWVDYAKTRAETDRPDYRERSDVEVPISVNQTLSGRLGIGDRVMPRALDRPSEGALNDVYVLELSSSSDVIIRMRSGFVSAHLTLLDSSGRRLEGDGGSVGDATIQRKLAAGKYLVWAGAMSPPLAATRDLPDSGIGTYTLSVADR
jgi:hypothetical protein